MPPRKPDRDSRSGRFVATSNTPEAHEGDFPTYSDMPVGFEGANPAEMQFPVMRRYAPEADALAQGDEYPPGIRKAVLVDQRDVAFHNGALRSYVRENACPDDPVAYLVGLPGSDETESRMTQDG